MFIQIQIEVNRQTYQYGNDEPFERVEPKVQLRIAGSDTSLTQEEFIKLLISDEVNDELLAQFEVASAKQAAKIAAKAPPAAVAVSA